MDSTLTKTTTLLFLVATFCLAGHRVGRARWRHLVTAPVYPPDESPFSPPLPPSVNPPADSPFSPPSPPSVDPPVDSPFSPLPPPSVDPPADSPVSPPLPQPVDPPAQPPVPRRPGQWGVVAIKGDVFCQFCKHAGSDDLTGASPIFGAVVNVQCKINETVIKLIGVTFGHGYFILRKINVNINDFDKCKAYLVSSPLVRCNIPTDLHGVITGGELQAAQDAIIRQSFLHYLHSQTFRFPC